MQKTRWGCCCPQPEHTPPHPTDRREPHLFSLGVALRMMIPCLFFSNVVTSVWTDGMSRLMCLFFVFSLSTVSSQSQCRSRVWRSGVSSSIALRFQICKRASVLRFLAGSCAPRAGGAVPRPPLRRLITGSLSVMKESWEKWRSFSPLLAALTRHKAPIRRGGDSGDEVAHAAALQEEAS